jgi:hypothetical protein
VTSLIFCFATNFLGRMQNYTMRGIEVEQAKEQSGFTYKFRGAKERDK